MLKKTCTTCRIVKPYYRFYRNRKYPPTVQAGYWPTCKMCHSLKCKKYYQENTERVRAVQKKWRRNNPMIKRLSDLAWAAENPERVKAIKRKSRVKRRINGIIVEDIDYSYIIRRDKQTCYLCGEVIVENELHFDHVIPISRGGSHTTDNLCCTHDSCNLRKSKKLVSELDWVI